RSTQFDCIGRKNCCPSRDKKGECVPNPSYPYGECSAFIMICDKSIGEAMYDESNKYMNASGTLTCHHEVLDLNMVLDKDGKIDDSLRQRIEKEFKYNWKATFRGELNDNPGKCEIPEGGKCDVDPNSLKQNKGEGPLVVEYQKTPTEGDKNKTDTGKLPTCTDKEKNGQETGVDCGGPACDPCPLSKVGSACKQNEDCETNLCIEGKCQEAKKPACDDGVMNGDETGADCGGSCKNKCDLYQECLGNEDCSTGICLNNACVATAENKQLLSFICQNEMLGGVMRYICRWRPAVAGFIPPSVTYNGKKYGGYTLEFSWQGVTFEWPLPGEVEAGTTPGEFGALPEAELFMGGISAILDAGADAQFSPSTVNNVYGTSSNPGVRVSTSDDSIKVSVENKTVDGKNVTVVTLKVDKKASGNKTITVALTGEDENGDSVDIGTMNINAEIRPAPFPIQKTAIISGIVLGFLAIIGILVKLYLKEATSGAISAVAA
ncbi:MAG: hypothetical protein KKE23_03295, partial [Nanoarchaeota archaeon]|nr:hypothetical protein [Nanoarchaeota archaeon]